MGPHVGSSCTTHASSMPAASYVRDEKCRNTPETAHAKTITPTGSLKMMLLVVVLGSENRVAALAASTDPETAPMVGPRPEEVTSLGCAGTKAEPAARLIR
jgi:hypothetical protein